MVFTHGLRVSPRSTAFLASSAAPIITDGLEVLVHEVIAAITTAPWSISVLVPSARVTRTGLLSRPPAPCAALCTCRGASSPLPESTAGASLAGKDSCEASSTVEVVAADA